MNQRTQQIDRTRSTILDAAEEMVFGTANPEDFTMQNVADAAGVSHRTLYRYFPSRQELIDAVGERYDVRLEGSVAAEVLDSFEAWVGGVDQLLAFGALHSDMLRRTISLSVLGGEWRRDRDRAYWKLFRSRFPHLSEAEARQDFAVLRHVLWASNAVLIGQRFDLNTEELSAAVERAVHALVSDISERDRAAERSETERKSS